MAKQFWPAVARSAAGSGSPIQRTDWFTVIGVTPDINLYGVDPGNEQAPAVAYVPFAYQQFLNTGLTIRVDGEPASITSAVREAIRASDPNLPMFQVRTDLRTAAPQLLAVRSVRLDLRHDRAWSACCLRRSASTASCRTRCRSERRRSVCAWRSAPEAREILRLVVGQGSCWRQSASPSGVCWPPPRCRPRARSSTKSARSIRSRSPPSRLPCGGRVPRELPARAARDESRSGRRVARRINPRFLLPGRCRS